MKEISFRIESNEEIWELIDKKYNSIYIHKFNPNAVVEWWQTDLKIKSGKEFKDLKVRGMVLDIQTNLEVVKEIIEMNTFGLDIYQFEKPIPDTLVFERLPKISRNNILKQNGLKHCYFLNYEYITVQSFDPSYIQGLEKQFFGRIVKS